VGFFFFKEVLRKLKTLLLKYFKETIERQIRQIKIMKINLKELFLKHL